ncbi:MAG TPA: PHP domain-containing protein [Vicinamibacteria bacterium]|nr:PHP domain-containing protein [Vicinamibacteria bacterium]
MRMLADFHLHSIASDGELDPEALVTRAAAHGVRALAITDHDTLGAYRWRDGAAFTAAGALGVELTVGVELDVSLDGREVHLLGLGLDRGASALGDHLESARRARHERAQQELALVRARLGDTALVAEDVFVPGRESLMRPHLIRPLVARGIFASYQQGRDWFHENARTGVAVPKPEIAEAIVMVHSAGGQAVLAHPGYYWKDGYPILERLASLRVLGLDGVELDYPYASSSPELFGDGEEERFVAALRTAGNALRLRFTRGSDAHRPADFDRVYGPKSA